MDNIADLLSSISPDDLEKLKNVAAGIMGNSNSGNSSQTDNTAQNNQSSQNPAQPLGGTNPFASMFGDDMTKTLMTVASQMNKEDDRTHFISALKPLLSDERRQKADEAMKFLKLMEMLPLIKGMFNI